MKRKRLSKAKRAEILARQGGLCVVWGCTESRGLIEEHSTPFTWTGAEADQLMCVRHHKEKTRADIKKIAKVKRLRRGPRKSKRPIKSRNTLKKHPTLKKQMGTGKVVTRG